MNTPTLSGIRPAIGVGSKPNISATGMLARAQPLRDRDRGIGAGRMPDQHHRLGRAAVFRDDLAGEIAGRIHAVHAGIDAALLDPFGQIVEAGGEHLADQTAQQIDVAGNAASGRARRSGGILVDDRAAASGEQRQRQPDKRGEDRGDGHPDAGASEIYARDCMPLDPIRVWRKRTGAPGHKAQRLAGPVSKSRRRLARRRVKRHRSMRNQINGHALREFGCKLRPRSGKSFAPYLP